MAETLEIDLRKLRGRALFEKLRDEFHLFCLRELEADILVADRSVIPMVRAFVHMSGCKSEVVERPDHWDIRVSGDACTCR